MIGNRHSSKHITGIAFSVIAVGILLLFIFACSGNDLGVDRTALEIPEPGWQELLHKTPLPYLTPLPSSNLAPIDGLYAKVDLSPPQAWMCRRCADYRPAGGIWRLQFDRGVMRIYYEVTGWKSLASYSISGDRLYIFNDPYCPEVVGEYRWDLQNGDLFLEVVSDACSISLRGINLSVQQWRSCSSSSENPVGCSTVEIPVSNDKPLGISVHVHPGDSRFFTVPPEIMVTAGNGLDDRNTGISLIVSEGSIPYGLNRILWWGGNWIEASTEKHFKSMGVQFMGDPQIGWARVLLDGDEVWRGDTSEIWSKQGRHGGYVEILVESSSPHTIRVESLDFDYRPVTIASFGFRVDDGVIAGD